MIYELTNIKAGNSITIYTVGYHFNDIHKDIINIDTNKVTCYDETDKKYIYSNVNNLLTVTDTNGTIKINATFVKSHTYLLTFLRKSDKIEDKIFKIRFTAS